MIIDKLNQKQINSFPKWVKKWTDIGLSTQPMNRKAAAEGVKQAYKAAGFQPPQRIIYAASPIGGLVAKSLAEIDVFEEDGYTITYDEVNPVVDINVPGVSISTDLSAIYGNHEAGSLSFYDWFAAHGLHEHCAPMRGLIEVSKHASWWWAYENLAIVTDRPELIVDEVLDSGGRRLHCADGPAVCYRDGYRLFSWHGVTVPEWVVMSPTVELVNSCSNTEYRRCGIENLGWDNYLDAMRVEAVSVEPDPGNPGRDLELYCLPGDMQVFGEVVNLLVMRNAAVDGDGTRRVFAETVPASVTSAVEAAAWQFDVPVGVYREMIRAS